MSGAHLQLCCVLCAVCCPGLGALLHALLRSTALLQGGQLVCLLPGRLCQVCCQARYTCTVQLAACCLLLPADPPLPPAPCSMGVKGQRKGRIRSGENGPVQMYDGRIHLPLSLVNQHLQGVTFPYHLTGIYHITRGSQTIVHEVGRRQQAPRVCVWGGGGHSDCSLLQLCSGCLC